MKCGQPRKLDGKPCENVVANEGDVCYKHDPAKAERRAKAAKRLTRGKLIQARHQHFAMTMGYAILLDLEDVGVLPRNLMNLSPRAILTLWADTFPGGKIS